ncbi:hypothetical protein BROC_01204 [Candidatus Brocadiaceae bacterium]|nr:hypothetical protein BROC_01204 [Candidatus Brocadiaceae bacterium]
MNCLTVAILLYAAIMIYVVTRNQQPYTRHRKGGFEFVYPPKTQYRTKSQSHNESGISYWERVIWFVIIAILVIGVVVVYLTLTTITSSMFTH